MLETKLLNPFVEATKYTLKVQANVDALAKDPYIKKLDFKSDIAAKVELVGPGVVGTVCLCFEEKSYLNVLSLIFKKQIATLNDDYADGAAELLNIISTHARKSFMESGMTTKSSHPIPLLGDKLAFVSGFTDSMVVQPFEIPNGKFLLQIDIKRQI